VGIGQCVFDHGFSGHVNVNGWFHGVPFGVVAITC
jgi:hypothetical protein